MPQRSKPGVNWDAIRQRYEAGETPYAIHKSGVGVSKQAIQQRVEKHGWVQTQGSRNVATRQATHMAQAASLASSARAPVQFKGWWGKDTPETRAFVIDAIDRGATQKLAAQAAGVHENTLLNWKSNDPEFAAQIEAARSHHAIEHIGVIDHAGRETKDWKASAHLLSKNPLTKAEFGDTAKAGGPVINVVLNVARGSAEATIGHTIDVTDTVTIEHD